MKTTAPTKRSRVARPVAGGGIIVQKKEGKPIDEGLRKAAERMNKANTSSLDVIKIGVW